MRAAFAIGTLCVVISAAACTPCTAQRAWFISPGGVDASNECQDVGNPCATLAHALSRIATNTIHPADTLYFAPGVYTEGGHVLPRSMIWSAPGAEQTILQAAADPEVATNRVLTVPVGTTLLIEGLTIRHGHAPAGLDQELAGGAGGAGGGILNNGSCFLVECRVVSNRAGQGGSGELGGPGGDGGGIYSDGDLVLSNSVVAFNESGRGGLGSVNGGRAGNGWGLHTSGRSEIRETAIHDNRSGEATSAPENGGAAGRGGIWNAGFLLIWNSTIADNHGNNPGIGTNGLDGAASQGGGLWNGSVATTLVQYATLAGNEADVAPAIYNASGGVVQVSHAICADSSFGEFELQGPALFEQTVPASFVGAVDELMGPVNPQLGALAYQGGITPVRRLMATSPAINAGALNPSPTPELDQRGAPRIQGGRIDLGAYELQSSVLYVSETGVDGTNECRSLDAPCASMAHAIARALPGDEVQLLSGVLTESGVLLDRPLSIVGAGSTNSIWQGAALPDAATDRLLLIPSGVTGLITDVTMRHGRAQDGTDADPGADGGAVHNAGVLQLRRCRMLGNRAGTGGALDGAGGRGGAIYNDGSLHIEDSVLGDNRAGAGSGSGDGGSGGAIHNDAALQVLRTEFEDNRAGDADSIGAGGSGGAVFNAGLASFADSTFAANRAGDPEGRGGAIFNEDTLGGTNLTMSGNMAGTSGAGGGIANGGFITIRHATIVSNSVPGAGGSGGGLQTSVAENKFGHMLLSGNSADTGPDAEGIIDSLGYNLVGDSSDLVLDQDGGTSLLDVPGGVLAFADNGGPTRTHELAPSSPARDAGSPAFVSPPELDQRGRLRRQGPRIDIGAVESIPSDSDGDGMPDYWEVEVGFDPFDPGITNALQSADADPDGDGIPSRAEYVAGTSPTSSNDVFRFESFRVGTGTVAQFQTRVDRLYNLQSSVPGPSFTWVDVPPYINLPGSGGTTTVIHATGATGLLYRLSVGVPW